MSNTEVIAQIISLVGQDMLYMLPIIGVMAGIKVVLDIFFDATFDITGRHRRH
jgi:hypothetical protein